MVVIILSRYITFDERMSSLSKYVILICMSVNNYLPCWAKCILPASNDVRARTTNISSLHIAKPYNYVFNVTRLNEVALFFSGLWFSQNFVFPAFSQASFSSDSHKHTQRRSAGGDTLSCNNSNVAQHLFPATCHSRKTAPRGLGRIVCN